MCRFRTVVLFFVVLATCLASDWPNWRGPYFTGAGDENGLPAALDDAALLWKQSMPGPAASTPIMADGRLFVTSTHQEANGDVALCFDAADGTPRWSKVIVTEGRQPRRNNFTSCSPVAYEGGAVFLFGDGALVRLDADGERVWSRDLVEDFGPLTFQYGFSSSPLLYEGKLYISVLRGYKENDPESLKSYLLCVRAEDGETVFKHTRVTDAVREGQQAYSTPVVMNINGAAQIIVYGADYLTGHAPDTGKELWRYCSDPQHRPNGRVVTSPTFDGNILMCMTTRGPKTLALDIEKLTAGEPGLVWEYDQQGADVASPVYYKGCVYLLDDRGKILKCVNAADGTEYWSGELDKSDVYYASITAADDKLFLVNRKGALTVVAADSKEFRILSTRTIGEASVDSTIAVAEGKVYLRTAENLYCFGSKD